MLPLSYGPPAAVALVMGGAVACFAGYRWFRIVLAIYGFIAGAMLASSTLGSSNTTGLLVAALVGLFSAPYQLQDHAAPWAAVVPRTRLIASWPR